MPVATANSPLQPLLEEAHRVCVCAKAKWGLQLDLSRVAITIASRGRKNALGWFARDRWLVESEHAAYDEINLCAETLATCDMGELILHELAHAENRARGIKDCSRRGKYHTSRFKDMAEALGLIVERHPSIGFAITKLGPEAEQFLKDIKFDAALFKMCRLEPVSRRREGKENSGSGSKMALWECKCDEPIKIRSCRDLNVTCNECDQLFEKKGD